MNTEPSQFELFEKNLGDSLERICESAPPAPQAEAIFTRLRRRNMRRIGGGVTLLVLLACGVFMMRIIPGNPQELIEPLVIQPPILIDTSAKTQTPRPWILPTMKLTAVSLPDVRVQDHLTADIPASSIPSEAARMTPNIPMRFVTPHVSLPSL